MEINIGLELEGCYNKDNIPRITPSGYHQGSYKAELGGFWKAEQDHSISAQRKFSNSTCIEFVSRRLKGKEEFLEALNKFKLWLSCGGLHELKDVADFNSSCGCHVHFSFPGFKLQDRFVAPVYYKITDLFLTKLRASAISSKADIERHYNRGYAARFKPEHLKTKERYSEFNFRSEDYGQGLEWRSPNLLNIKTWADFAEFFDIIYSVLEEVGKLTEKYKVEFKEPINLKQIKEESKMLEHQRVKFKKSFAEEQILKISVKKTEEISVSVITNKPFVNDILANDSLEDIRSRNLSALLGDLPRDARRRN